MVYEIDDKYKDRFLYSYSASCIMVQSVNRLGNSLIPCDVYIYVKKYFFKVNLSNRIFWNTY